MTNPRVDELLHTSFSLTLGQVVEKLEGAFSPDLDKRLKGAVEHRNFLAHHFWFERCHLMYSKENLLRLHADLRWYRDLFDELGDAVMEVVNPLLRSVGVTDDLFANAMNQILSGYTRYLHKVRETNPGLGKVQCKTDRLPIAATKIGEMGEGQILP